MPTDPEPPRRLRRKPAALNDRSNGHAVSLMYEAFFTASTHLRNLTGLAEIASDQLTPVVEVKGLEPSASTLRRCGSQAFDQVLSEERAWCTAL